MEAYKNVQSIHFTSSGRRQPVCV